MLKVLFFARLREELGCDGLEVPWSEELTTPAAVLTHLRETGAGDWHEVLGTDNLLCAVNQRICDDETPLCDGDEVAFFPPMTGG